MVVDEPRSFRTAVDDDAAGFDKELSESMDNVIVVDHIPVVPPEKVQKLKSVLGKLYSKFGDLVNGNDGQGIFMPMNDSGTESKGFAFIEFEDKQNAIAAVEQTEGYKLDKAHVFSVYLFPEFKRITEVPDEYAPPPPQEFKERGYLKQWLLDAKARDQYVIRYMDESEIFWNDTPETKEEDRRVFARKKWTDLGHQWSPHGTYLATFHKPGIRLWGGEKFESAGRFEHSNVKLIDFSPKESFLVTVTWCDRASDKQDDEAVVIWDLRTGAKKRAFKNEGAKDKPIEPFKWSFDDKYFAKISEDAIQVYSSEDMKLLDKKSLKLPGVKEFHWSPTQNAISAYIPAQDAGQSPARVVLIEIPSRNELRQKNLFSVSDIQMLWHPDGTYLAVKVERKKGKAQTSNSFELFRVKEKDIPIEVLDIPSSILPGQLSFAWEPKGHRFVVLHGEPPRIEVSIYSMLKESKAVVNLLKTLEKKSVNEIYWSPAGRHVLLSGLKNLNGALNFFNADELESMSEDEHFMATDVEWDPTGRYVCTYVSAFRQPMENGYTIWNFAGKPQLRVTKDKFYQFMWRPRPPSLLSAQEEREIRRKLGEYSARYLEEDRRTKEMAATAHIREKEAKRREFQLGEDRRRALYLEWQEERRGIRGYVTDDDEEYEFVDETFEEILDTREERL